MSTIFALWSQWIRSVALRAGESTRSQQGRLADTHIAQGLVRSGFRGLHAVIASWFERIAAGGNGQHVGPGLLCVVLCGVIVAASPRLMKAEEVEDYQVQIFVGDADGSNFKRLTDLPEYKSQGSPCWSADGRFIAFDAYKPQRGEQFFDGHIIVVNADGTKPRDLGLGILPSLSPKGHRVAYCRHPKMGEPGVWIGDVTDLDSRILLDEKGWGAEWSPDGNHVAYSRGGNLYLFNLIEETILPIIDVEQAGISKIEWNFCWSADSRRIAFKAITDDNRQILAIANAEGGQKGIEIAYEGSLGPAMTWRPHKNEVLIEWFVEDRQNFYSLFRVNLDEPGTADRFPSRPVDRRVRNPAFSPDGKKLAASIYRKQPGDD